MGSFLPVQSLKAQSFVTVGNVNSTLTNQRVPINRLSYSAYNRYAWSNILLVESLLTSLNLPSGVLIDSIAFFKSGTNATIHPFDLRLFVGPANQLQPPLLQQNWQSVVQGKKEVLHDSVFDLGTLQTPVVLKFNRSYPYWSGGLQLATLVDYGPFPGIINTGSGPNWLADNSFRNNNIHYISNSPVFDSLASSTENISFNRMPVMRIYYRSRQPRDLGVRAITQPTQFIQPNTTYTVQVEVTNEGTDTLHAANLSYQIAQGASISQSFSLNLPPDSSTILSFSTPFQLPVGYEFGLRVWLNHLNGGQIDQVPSNDSLRTLLYPLITGDTIRVGQQQAFPNLQTVFDRLLVSNNPVARTILLYENQVGKFTLSDYQLPDSQTLVIRGIHDSIRLESTQIGSLLFLNRVRGLQLHGLHFTHRSNAITTDFLLHIKESERLTLQNNRFLGATGSSRNDLVMVENSRELVVNHNVFSAGNQAFHVAANQLNAAVRNFNISNNRFENHNSHGICFSGTQMIDSLWIESNELHNSLSPASTAAGFDFSNVSRLTISRNKITGQLGRFGIRVYHLQGDSLQPNRIANNVVSGTFAHNASSALRVEGLNQGTDSMRNQVEIYFNSFQLRRLAAPGFGTGVVNFMPANATRPAWNRFIFQNNLVLLDAPANANSAGALATDNIGVLNHPSMIFSHNHYHVPGQSIYLFNQGGWYTSLASFRQFYAHIDTASTSGDPLVSNAQNDELYFLSRSPLRGTGLPIASVTTDHLGNQRNNPTDRGAYTLQASVNRTHLTQIVSPAPTSILQHDSNYALTVKIKNIGGNPITNIDFGYVFGGGDTLLGNWTGQLAVDDSLLYTFAQPLRIPADSVFIPILKVWNKQLPGSFTPSPQLDTLNNEYCTPLSAGTYLVDNVPDGPRNIKAWLRMLNCAGVTGPVVLKTDFQNNLLLNESLLLENIAGASSTNHIVLNGDGDTLRSSNPVFPPHIHLKRSKHIRIQGFVFDLAIPTSTLSMLVTENTEHITIINNHFLHRSTFWMRSAVRAIAYLVGPNSLGDSYYLRIDSNRFEGPFLRGIELLGNLNAVHHHVYIRHNQIRTRVFGLEVAFIDTGDIAYNDVSINNNVDPLTAGIALQGNNTELKVHHNKIHGLQSPPQNGQIVGIYVRSRPLIPASKNYIFNNLIFDINGSRSKAGIYASRTDSVEIVNNTIYINDSSEVLETYGIWLDSASIANVWNNNISISPWPGANAAALRYNQPWAQRFDNNNYHVAISNPLSQFIIRNASATFATLGAHQLAFPQFDAQSHSNLPIFKDLLAQDFVPKSPLLYQSGRVIPYVTTDFSGLSRPVTPSIGALEDTLVAPTGILLSAFLDFRNENGGTQPQRQVPLELFVVGSNAIDSLVLQYRKNQDNWQIDSTLINVAGRQVIQRTFGPGLTLRTGTDTLQAIATAYYGSQIISDTVIRIVQNQFLSPLTVPYSNNFDSLQNINEYQLIEREYSMATILGPPGFNNVIQGQSSLVMRAKPNAVALPVGTSMANAFTNAPNHVSEVKMWVNPGRTGKLRVSFSLRMINNLNTNFFRLQVNDSTITAQPGLNVNPVIVQTSNMALRFNFVLDNINTGAPFFLQLQSVVAPVTVSGGGFACNIIDSLQIYFEPDVDFTGLTAFSDTLCGPMARNISVTATPFQSTINTIHLQYNTAAGSWASLPMTANGQPDGYSVVLPPQPGVNLVRYAVSTGLSNGLSWTSDTVDFQNTPYRLDLGPDKTIFVGQSASLNTSLADLGMKGLRITEFQYLRSGQGFHPNYPPGITSAHDDLVEIANYGKETVALDRAELHFIGQSANSFFIYHFPPGTTLAPLERAIVVLASGTNDPSTKLFFTSHPATVNILYASSLKGYVVLREKSSQRFLDALCINDSVFPASMNVPAQLWSGFINGSNRSGIQRNNLNEVNAQAWTLNSNTNLHTVGSIDSSLQLGPAPQNIRWYDASGQLLATGDSLVVSPSITSQYSAEVDWLGCIKTDTIIVQVTANPQPDLSISAILNPLAVDTVVLNAPLVARLRVKNLSAAASSSFTLGFTADSTFVGSVVVAQGLAGYDSIDVSLPAWTPDPRSYDLCFNVATSNDYDSTNNSLCLRDVHFTLTISVQDLAKGQLLVYPNPVQELLYLRAPAGALLQGQWLATDAMGRQIALPEVVEIAPGLIQFSVSQLAAGVYYLQLSGPKAIDLQKIKFVVVR